MFSLLDRYIFHLIITIAYLYTHTTRLFQTKYEQQKSVFFLYNLQRTRQAQSIAMKNNYMRC